MAKRIRTILFLLCLAAVGHTFAQSNSTYIEYNIPSQNLLKYNRFLLNPTFSAVKQPNAYINMHHRNQSAMFDNNFETYLISFNGRLGERSGMGLAIFNQREGIVDNFGAIGNYAYGIKLSEAFEFTFGANVIYYISGVNQNRANPIAPDPTLLQLENTSFILVQPGFNISYANFDLGVFAENLVDYNLGTNEMLTEFAEKTLTGHLQYSHTLKTRSGLFENGIIRGLGRVKRIGDTDLTYGGSLIFDVPSKGWLQLGYDDFFGVSAGIGFVIAKKVALGYTAERGLTDNLQNLGLNHEVTLAYNFTKNRPNRTSKRKKSSAKDDKRIKELEEEVKKNNKLIDSLVNKLNQKDTSELRNVRSLDDNGKPLKDGYYLVANLFKSKKYHDRYVKELKNKGFKPKSFENTSNDFKYVYLRYYRTKNKATDAYRRQVVKNIDKDIWIIQIKDSKMLEAEVISLN